MALMIAGNLLVDAEIASDDFYDIAFNNNVVQGDAIFKTKEVTKDVTIDGCNFGAIGEFCDE